MFELKKERLFHMPHNTAIAEELFFLLEIIDLNRKFYSFQELSKLFLIEQIRHNRFSEFHKTPHKKLTNTHHFIYKRFIDNPDLFFDEFMNIKYSQTKTWKNIWVEFARDYIDFAAYLGLLPCYFKTPNRGNKFDGYLVSKKLKSYRKNKISFSKILMDYKYSNASINISQYSQYNISVRPFYLGLKLLFKLKQLGIDKIENRLFFSSVGCTSSEDLNEVTSYLNNWIKEKGNFLNSKNHSDSFQKEATRIATGMKKFYYKCDLIKKEKVGILTYVSITKKGEVLFLNTPPNTLFYGKTDKNTGLYYSPIIARLLSVFSNNVKNHLFEINKENLTDSFKGFKGLDVFDITLKNISDLNPSPIKKIDDDKILLNDFSCQYEVSPYNDFCNENEINFIYNAVINVDNIDLKSKKLELPNQAYINELNEAARSGDGDRYELAIYKAFSLLPGSCKHFGSSYTGQRVSDVVWKISMPTTDGNKTYLVLIEAKSGSAIKSLNERNIIPQLENTIEFYFSEFDNIDGLWVLICNSDKIPSQASHGGFRGANSNQLSFNQKLFKIQEAINNRFGRTTLVTAFGIEAFIDYYKYLYSNSRFTLKNNTIDKAFLTEFFTYGSLFTMNFSVKSTVFKNSTEFNNML